jgi:hypothetical protein
VSKQIESIRIWTDADWHVHIRLRSDMRNTPQKLQRFARSLIVDHVARAEQQLGERLVVAARRVTQSIYVPITPAIVHEDGTVEFIEGARP